MDMYSKFESLLEKYNTTAYKVGKATNITSSTFSNWKNGISTPKVDKLQKIADFFGVPVGYFLQHCRLSVKFVQASQHWRRKILSTTNKYLYRG